MDGLDLNVVWFSLLGVLLTGYAILDGFDLGMGIMHPVARGDRERRLFMNSIGPLWDGNEVWLVTFGGALFAAFPDAYATVFSGFYLAFMLLLTALIFRAVSLEFRSKRSWAWWRGTWDLVFFVSSTLATFLFGVAVGNAMKGMPIDADREFTGGLIDLLGPYPLLIGLFAVSVFAMHGTIFLYLKTEGELQARLREMMWTTFGLFLFLYMFTTVVTLVTLPSATENFREIPWAWGVVVLSLLAIANIPRAIYINKPGYAFLSSCCTIGGLTFLFGMAIYPNLVVSATDAENNLTIYNAASSDSTLGIMLIIAILGMPFVIAYTIAIYWFFRGKTRIDKFSY